MTVAEETQQALNYLRETILDLVESKDAEIRTLRDSNQSLSEEIEELERELDQAKARIEELAPPVYREAS